MQILVGFSQTSLFCMCLQYYQIYRKLRLIFNSNVLSENVMRFPKTSGDFRKRLALYENVSSRFENVVFRKRGCVCATRYVARQLITNSTADKSLSIDQETCLFSLFFNKPLFNLTCQLHPNGFTNDIINQQSV